MGSFTPIELTFGAKGDMNKGDFAYICSRIFYHS